MPLFTSELSYSDDYPTIEPSLKLDFANARALDPRITFTRASTGTYVGRDGLIKTAGEDEARFDHDPTTGESLGLLIEASRTNLLKGTSNFASGYWTIGGNRSAQGSNQLAPDGTLSAFSNVYNGTSGDANIYYSDAGNNAGGEAPTSNNTAYTLSVFAKVPSSNNYIQGIFVRTYNDNNSALFNLKTGTIVGTNEGTTTNRIEAYPNGWYRCSITFTSGTDGNQGVQFYLSNEFNSATLNDPSANGEALYYWAPQLEAGAFPTSYIPTSGSTATRAAEQAYMTGESFSSWYNPTEGSVVTAFNPTLYVGFSDGGRAFRIDHQTISDNRIDYVVTGSGGYQPYVSINGVAPTGFGGGPSGGTAFVVGTDYKISVGFAANDYVGYKNGSQTFSSTTPASVPIADRLSLGLELNGHRKFFYYYPKRLTNTQLQTLTQ